MSEGDDVPVVVELLPLGDGANAAMITLNRPDDLNAIVDSMLDGLDQALDQCVSDSSVRCAFLTGAGRAFSAGGDLKSYISLQRDPVEFPAFVVKLHRVFGRIREVPIPVIGLINGVAAAGGLELMLSCDWCIAAESAVVADGHLNFGQMGGGGVLTLLPKALGVQRAAELLFTGRFLDSHELVEWGLVSRVVPDGELVSTALAVAAEIVEKSPLALANAKEIMNAIWSSAMGVDAGLRLERERNAYYCLLSHDAKEGLVAFSEKRRPRFTGR
jgi:enoyl-CoA hydratase/carnithine racemase